jgi:hypothetical protein
MALVALGEALEANGRPEQAARAYGSIVDLYPGRADMRRLAAGRLERLGEQNTWLVLDSYGRALEQRYDDPAGHRLYAFALVRAGYYQEAFERWSTASRGPAPTRRPARSSRCCWPTSASSPPPGSAAGPSRRTTCARPCACTRPSWRPALAALRAQLGQRARRPRPPRARRPRLARLLPPQGARLRRPLSDDMDAGYGLEAFIIDGPPGRSRTASRSATTRAARRTAPASWRSSSTTATASCSSTSARSWSSSSAPTSTSASQTRRRSQGPSAEAARVAGACQRGDRGTLVAA